MSDRLAEHDVWCSRRLPEEATDVTQSYMQTSRNGVTSVVKELFCMSYLLLGKRQSMQVHVRRVRNGTRCYIEERAKSAEVDLIVFEFSLLVDARVELLVRVFSMLNCLKSLQSLCKAASNIEDKSGVMLKPSNEVSIQSCRANVDKLLCYQGKRQTAVIKWRPIQLKTGKDKIPQ